MFFVTSNKNKYNELKQILPHIEQLDAHLDEIQSLDFEEIAIHKAKQAYEMVKDTVIVEDSGFVVDDWKGLPGPFTKFMEEGFGMERLASFASNQSGYGVSCFVVYDGNTPKIFMEKVSGTITSPKGSGGFGYDPIFIPNGYTKTFAEMSEAERAATKPRFKNLEKMKQLLHD